MKKIILASVLAIGIATAGLSYAHVSGYGRGESDDMMYGRGGCGMMGDDYGCMGPGMMDGHRGYNNDPNDS